MGERCLLDPPFEREKEPYFLMVETGERLQAHQPRLDGGQRYPITTTRSHERTS